MRVENKLNINNKITEWLSEHNETLNDLSNYCGLNRNELLAAINRPLETNKVILNDGTEFSVLKRDKETNVALLKNENSGFYNVACGINKENNGWEHSLVYCENYDTAKLFYANKTAEKMDYERYRTIGYLKENYPSIELENLVNIVNDAKEIYQYSVDDQVGERITLEDLSEFITKMYIEKNYQDKGYTFVQSPIHNMESTMLLEKFYDYDFKNEASKSLTVTNIDNIHYLTSKTVNELKTNDEENVHYDEISKFESYMLSNLPNYKCYITPEYTDHNTSLESYESDLQHAFDSILMRSDTTSGFDLKFDNDGDLVMRTYGGNYSNQSMKIKESKIIAVNDENEKVNIYHEIFGDEQDLQQSQEEIENEYEGLEI